jgi:hypothetical protein
MLVVRRYGVMSIMAERGGEFRVKASEYACLSALAMRRCRARRGIHNCGEVPVRPVAACLPLDGRRLRSP